MKNDLKNLETPLLEIDIFKDSHKLKHTFVKDESKNIFGTVKDRRNFQIVQVANRLKVDKIVLITSGNNGYSLSNFTRGTTIKVVCVISKDLPVKIKKLLYDFAYQVIELNLDHKILRPEELITFAREKDDEVIWDVTNGFEENYFSLVDEIFKDIKPDYIVVPIGSGGIFIGVAEAIEKRGGKTRVIGIGVQNSFQSFADKLPTPWTPYSKALLHYQKMGHPIYRLTEEEIKKTYHKFQNVVDCEPTSAVVFAAPEKHKFKSDDKIVFVNSGKGLVS